MRRIFRWSIENLMEIRRAPHFNWKKLLEAYKNEYIPTKPEFDYLFEHVPNANL